MLWEVAWAVMKFGIAVTGRRSMIAKAKLIISGRVLPKLPCIIAEITDNSPKRLSWTAASKGQRRDKWDFRD
jgi:hypothetical protein